MLLGLRLGLLPAVLICLFREYLLWHSHRVTKPAELGIFYCSQERFNTDGVSDILIPGAGSTGLLFYSPKVSHFRSLQSRFVFTRQGPSFRAVYYSWLAYGFENTHLGVLGDFLLALFMEQ